MIKTKSNEAGNVLFLILIAVALFAALSYAVTQSSRSGGSGSEREQGIVNAAGLTQYASSIRTAILRMTINNVGIDNVNYKNPGDADYATEVGTDGSNFMYHPDGGGATFQLAPDNVLTTNATNTTAGDVDGEWHFRDGLSITDLGSTQSEVVAYLTDVTVGVCEELNRRYGIATGLDPNVAVYNIADAHVDETIATGTADNTNTTYIASGGGTAPGGTWPTALDGEPFGCFCNSGTSPCPANAQFVYYHTLVER